MALLGDDVGTLTGRDEPGQASHDADVGLGADRLQRIREVLQMTTGDQLSGTDCGIGTATRLVDVPANIRIAKK